ncbi:fimbrial protein TcfA [Pseudomonas sp. SWRI196]|uniref:Fimbrial protein TcfA n=1 Tax=Pseudomonas tehranensis TaxID=2745502 RepID=A0ABR6UTU0_9PSED|nr:fimbrial protein TcfA [Pseudomonas tehranensis]MBC3347610.1 fimbrial protein TcfA [Pseudomonas tehranensis]
MDLNQTFTQRWAALSKLALLMLGFGLSSPAAANLVVYPMTSTIGVEQDGIGQIQLHSKSDKVQYIKVSVVQIQRPGTPDEHESPLSPADTLGIVVSPQRTVLAPGASRTVRIIAQAMPSEETVYRVYFEPVAAPQDLATEDDGPEGIQPKIGVNLIWGALVRLLPDDRQMSVGLQQSGDALRNDGNVRIGVLQLGSCTDAKGEKDCIWNDVNRSLYPGSTLPVQAAGAKGNLLMRFVTSDDKRPRTLAVLP